MEQKITWKRSYGDGEETDDTVLWINGKPVESCCVSQIGSECFIAYFNNEKIGYYDTRKEAKDAILDELAK